MLRIISSVAFLTGSIFLIHLLLLKGWTFEQSIDCGIAILCLLEGIQAFAEHICNKFIKEKEEMHEDI